MPSIELPIRAAKEMAIAHGISPDRCDILQNGSTLVLRLTDSLVARVVQDVTGPVPYTHLTLPTNRKV